MTLYVQGRGGSSTLDFQLLSLYIRQILRHDIATSSLPFLILFRATVPLNVLNNLIVTLSPNAHGGGVSLTLGSPSSLDIPSTILRDCP
jgi:hypothetical protein